MSNDFFQFKQFKVTHSRCAMKVGTDAVLLGSWANEGCNILDIGTGTGIIALMMSQRNQPATVTAIDIDQDAVSQARENVSDSPFHSNIIVELSDIQDFTRNHKSIFDCIVSNPPYFEDSLKCPDNQRSLARHTSSLPYSTLINCAKQLLTPNGHLSIIIPTESVSRIESETALQGLFIHRQCDIKTVERKPAKRTMLEIRLTPPTLFIKETHVLMEGNERSPWFQDLTQDFYLD